MRETIRRSMVMALIAMLLIGAVAPVALAAANLNGLIPSTPFSQNARRYTALALEGVAVPVYAFNDAAGLTQYRVYGSLTGKTGFFEAELLAPIQPGGEVTLNVKGVVPANDKLENFATYSVPTQRAQTVVPAGFQQGKSSGIVYIRNYFNQREFFAYASRDQVIWQYFYTDGYGRAIRGGLPVAPESVQSRAKNYQTYLLPRAYREAHRLPAQYLVNSSDGQPLVVNGLTPVIPEDQLPVYRAPSPARTPRPASTFPLAQGSRGRLVCDVQKRLNALGYNAGYVDGIYGRKTAAAVLDFQKMNRLTLTSTVDKHIYDLLMSSSAIPYIPPVIPPQPEPNYEGSYMVKVNTTGGDLNLWSIPNPTKRAKYSIAKIPNGTILTGVAKGNNGFSKLVYQVDKKLLEGYVDSAYLNFNVPQPAP
jgi:peptidoglycan hydrolase-like protein with peptidoglycan-binding domain